MHADGQGHGFAGHREACHKFRDAQYVEVGHW